MPSRKSDASKSAAVDDSMLSQGPQDISNATQNDPVAPSEPATGTVNDKPASKAISSSKDPKDGIAIEDLSLPRSIVTRLAKSDLPPNTQIQANAVLAMQKGSTVFISYIASMANDFALQAGRKTVGPQDVFKALEEAELPAEWKEDLERELTKFNEIQADKRGAYRKKVAEGKKDKGADVSTISAADPEQSNTEQGDARASKKARMDEGADVTMGEDDEADVPGDETMGDEQEQEDDDVDEDEEAEEEDEDDGVDEVIEGEGEDKDEENDEALDNGEDSD